MAELLTISRMARRAGVPTAYLKDLVEAGKIPSLSVSPGRYLFNPQAVITALSRLAAECDGEPERVSFEKESGVGTMAEGDGYVKQAYTCSLCGDIFDRGDLGHCLSCAHHYLAGSECGNCHKHTLTNTMKRAGFTVAEWIANPRFGMTE